jgi:hypothetical protein
MISSHFWLVYTILLIIIVLSGLVLYLCEQDEEEPTIEGRKNGKK